MSERDGEGDAAPDEPVELPAVEQQLGELQRQKRTTVRWHMSRDTAERAIAAITGVRGSPSSTCGKSRRRKRHKRLL
jgi:hypothetical protein